jgi:hypothetical protein
VATKARDTAEAVDSLALKVDYATPFNNQAGSGSAAYTFVLADGSRITSSSASATKTFIIPPQSSVEWPNDTIIRVINYGAGALTIAGGSGVTVTNTAATVGQYESAAAIRTGSDAWTLVPFGSKAGAAPSSVEYLVIAGGGGGGWAGGGGGAGGYRCSVSGERSGADSSAESALSVTAGTSYTVTIGAGGAGADSSGSRGTSGSNSVFSSITSTGGGGGGNGVTSSNNTGLAGGSGGGGGGWSTDAGGAGTANQGTNGGTAAASGGGGGGGSNAVGGNATANNGAVGGNGTSSSITGAATTRTGGGGGRGFSSGGAAGSGGAGAGATGGAAGGIASANTGSGGGGGISGGAGGSGVVIIRHAAGFAKANTTGSPTVQLNTAGTHWVYIFNASGTIGWGV